MRIALPDVGDGSLAAPVEMDVTSRDPLANFNQIGPRQRTDHHACEASNIAWARAGTMPRTHSQDRLGVIGSNLDQFGRGEPNGRPPRPVWVPQVLRALTRRSMVRP